MSNRLEPHAVSGIARAALGAEGNRVFRARAATGSTILMHLPHPLARLVGCVWLPRLIAKTRLRIAGNLPRSYRIAFGHRRGVDGYFLRHFNLQMDEFIEAVREAGTDGAIGAWFLNQPGVTDEAIGRWNELAPELGARGRPGYWTLRLLRWFLYPSCGLRPLRSIFDAIVRDEHLPAAPPAPERFTGARPPLPPRQRASS